VARDENFSRAWYALFLASSNLDPRGEEARAALQKLETLSPEAWWTDVARTAAALNAWDWTRADATSSRALAALAPDKDATAFRATFLANVGRMREAVSLWHRAAANDKLSFIDSLNLQSALTSAREFEEAEREYERSLTLAGDSIEALFLALSRAFLTEPRDKDRLDKAFRAVLAHPLGSSALNRFVHENLDQPERVRARLQQDFASPASSSIQIALLADWFDDGALAQAGLRRALLEDGMTATSLLWVPLRTGMRSTPEFKNLVRRVGLVDYWRASGNWGDFCQPAGADDFTCR
jgi:tetratricopeptide (TPR) repeat protein